VATMLPRVESLQGGTAVERCFPSVVVEVEYELGESVRSNPKQHTTENSPCAEVLTWVGWKQTSVAL